MSQYSKEKSSLGVSSLIKLQAFKPATLLKRKETPIQVFSCEYGDIFKSTYVEEHLRMAASY